MISLALLLVVPTLLGLVLILLAPFVEESDTARIRSKIEGFWLSLADITTPARVQSALMAVRGGMRKRRMVFLKAFWVFLGIMFAIVCWENSMIVGAARDNFKSTINIDFTLVADLYYKELAKGDLFCQLHRHICNAYSDNRWHKELTRLVILEDEYNDLIDKLGESHPFILIVAADLATMLTLSILLIPLSVSLVVSFNLTLWMLSSLSASRLRLWFIVVASVLIAVASPLLLLNLFLFLAADIGALLGGGLWDLTGFDYATVSNLIIGYSTFVIALNFVDQSVTSDFLHLFSNLPVTLLTILFQLYLLPLLAYRQLAEFIDATNKVVHLDFSTNFLQGAINWAIFIDISYSLSFIFLALALVFLQRWSFGQRIFLNIVQWVAEHPKGPLYAFGEALSGLVAVIKKVVSG